MPVPNNPECAKFASNLRQDIFGAILTHTCYVSTLCVEIAPIINFLFLRILDACVNVCVEFAQKIAEKIALAQKIF